MCIKKVGCRLWRTLCDCDTPRKPCCSTKGSGRTRRCPGSGRKCLSVIIEEVGEGASSYKKCKEVAGCDCRGFEEQEVSLWVPAAVSLKNNHRFSLMMNLSENLCK